MHAATKRFEIWLKGLVVAAISGGSGGIFTGLAAVGLDPTHFNLQTGIGAALRLGLAVAIIGVAAYLQNLRCRKGIGPLSWRNRPTASATNTGTSLQARRVQGDYITWHDIVSTLDPYPQACAEAELAPRRFRRLLQRLQPTNVA